MEEDLRILLPKLEAGMPMRRLRPEAICREPNTSTPAPEHTIHPYLLRGLAITRHSQVLATDIGLCSVRLARGEGASIFILDSSDAISIRIEEEHYRHCPHKSPTLSPENRWHNLAVALFVTNALIGLKQSELDCC